MARCFLIYWLSVSEEEKEIHFQGRAQNLLKRSKLSDMDFKSRDKWIKYSKVKDEAFFIPISRRRPGIRLRLTTSVALGSIASRTFLPNVPIRT